MSLRPTYMCSKIAFPLSLVVPKHANGAAADSPFPLPHAPRFLERGRARRSVFTVLSLRWPVHLPYHARAAPVPGCPVLVVAFISFWWHPRRDTYEQVARPIKEQVRKVLMHCLCLSWSLSCAVERGEFLEAV